MDGDANIGFRRLKISALESAWNLGLVDVVFWWILSTYQFFFVIFRILLQKKMKNYVLKDGDANSVFQRLKSSALESAWNSELVYIVFCGFYRRINYFMNFCWLWEKQMKKYVLMNGGANSVFQGLKISALKSAWNFGLVDVFFWRVLSTYQLFLLILWFFCTLVIGKKMI
jgi:hypothetical protein